ncbi:MAG TPA: cation transporter [Nocardioidaceae bacterium]|nr:cation transporter [Nocardioidaceae bacterium]
MSSTAVTSTYTVTGMSCEHCVRAVTEEVSAITCVRDVEVDLASGRVSVTSERELTRSEVAEAVDEAGYQLA